MLKDLNLTIKKSAHRKTVGIAIYPDQRIVVSAPLRLKDTHVEAFLMRKMDWIQKKLKAFSNVPKIRASTFVSGERFPFLGSEYTLTVIHTAASYVTIFENQLVVSVRVGLEPMKQSKLIQKLLIQWYQEQALLRAKERIPVFTGQLRVTPTSVSVKKYSRRWGVCKSTGDIVLNWLLMHGSPEIFDYVVVHELCHLKEFNHSPKFWRLVASVCPDYKEIKKQLKLMSYQSVGSILGVGSKQ